MPGTRSLQAGEYYAHPQNLFWNIMGEILSFPPSDPYGKRVAALEKNSVALWDTLKFCERRGSLDSNINPASEKVNDVAALLEQNPSVRAVFFNGRKPEQVFKSRIASQMDGRVSGRLHFETLPSTSPANAGVTKKRKTEFWKKSLTRFALADSVTI